MFLAIAIVALPFLAAHVSPRLKLVVIFPVAVGIASGCLLLLAGTKLTLSRTWLRALAVIVVPLVLCAFEWESYRAWRAEYREMFLEHLHGLPGGNDILANLRDGKVSESPAVREMLAVYRDHLHPDVDRYLNKRSNFAVPVLNHPWQVSRNIVLGIMAAEVLLGMAGGIVVVFWNTRRCRDPEHSS